MRTITFKRRKKEGEEFLPEFLQSSLKQSPIGQDSPVLPLPDPSFGSLCMGSGMWIAWCPVLFLAVCCRLFALSLKEIK